LRQPSIAAPPNGCSSKLIPNACSTRVACTITSGPMPSPGRHTTLGTVDLLPSQVEDVAEELRDAGRRERALVGGLQLDAELLLAGGVAQRDALGALVLVQRAHELQPPIDRREQIAVGGSDLRSVVGDQAVTPSSSSSASTSASISTTVPDSC